jgi:predicted TIM-barrel fold metal-dependent hydrolase
MATLGSNFRAVAVVNTSVTDEELKRMHDLGVRGIRFNLVQQGATTLDMLEPLSKRVAAMGWHCQVHMLGAKILEAADTFLKIKGRLVFDHLARCPEPEGAASETFKLMRKLLDQGNTWVKLSGLYMDTKVGPPTYSDSVAVARAFATAAPTRVVWGSDWPHPTQKLDDKPNDAILFDLLAACVPDEAARKRVLVDNPADLYDFPKG